MANNTLEQKIVAITSPLLAVAQVIWEGIHAFLKAYDGYVKFRADVGGCRVRVRGT